MAKPMDALLTGRMAVVTGAASGNGRAIARRFAEHGADVEAAVEEAAAFGGVDITDGRRGGGCHRQRIERRRT